MIEEGNIVVNDARSRGNPVLSAVQNSAHAVNPESSAFLPQK